MDLSTKYLGLHLRTPLVASASPLSEQLDNIRALEEAGISAVVMHSLFEEQLTQSSLDLDHYTSFANDSFAEALSFFPEPKTFHVGPELYLEHIAQARQSVKIPIIASLNGHSRGGWIEYAKKIEQAGAAALELNLYSIPTDPQLSGAVIEQTYLDIVKEIKTQLNIPVAVKLSPFFTNFGHFAHQLSDLGVDGLVLFNRFYQPDINIETLEMEPHLLLSSPQELRLPLTWIGLLYGRIQADLAATTGVHQAKDVLKLLMAGAKVTQMASVLLRRGIGYVRTLESELLDWLEEHEYHSIEQLQGSMSQTNCPDPSAFERVQYVRMLQGYHAHIQI
ncbi:dihydroorotate dehydrogenase [bacterium (Candidatus Blackallbacteria) CG17_big_fil_post_rev_8_21_14_2_50_48_46]|uniref:Dihydroorotate dehydrogenase n=1 Tax=bacterium (Candidatus Blackallbacteria) CG17_big_fil_post_rev_8_21_14_2_50_48_46 TaxID=2014261 RepID=A0A2M7G4X7_9BACT|nr:MAG: dihydroorotate dehydrogenase [bacterium (Candidatus Blackallbacteria) CG18_big_fil_WC_8_21_14_2_50_49_26]PIW16971.1 MAG: dihydroorotate dehydrogenase [bacterium (Candidatus Blackallbacteria) CG17_big_fil_post_rev_8_21_14_2_50_48_46]PIW50250.1 MAG: dihydroorotate dehydrogenase [bacterium (Candidatus Blackallbacteria) CG13_big_fil_rev_8_21_14_2_50_49_14]